MPGIYIFFYDKIILFINFSSWFLAEDEEDTIAAQEKVEGNVNHAEELDDLAREGRVICFHNNA